MKVRSNSRLRQYLDETGVAFLEAACGSIQRILPHVETVGWREGSIERSAGAVWSSNRRAGIDITIVVGGQSGGRAITATVKRKSLKGSDAARTLDHREFDICKRIAGRISEVLKENRSGTDGTSLRAIRDSFDEYIVARHVEAHHSFEEDAVRLILDRLHVLAEQSYENKALTFGCIIGQPSNSVVRTSRFPKDFLEIKKFRALSDGFRTSYVVSPSGAILDFVDLEDFEAPRVTARNYFPSWAEAIANAATGNRCGISLSRQGDILIFEKGSLRFTYRFGKWQYWNHSHLLELLKGRARAQHVQSKILGTVVGSIYHAALDVSFRRSGGLFVLLKNRGNLHKIVKEGDAIGDPGRGREDVDFDSVIKGGTIQSIPRSVVVDLAALDGAVVLDNAGRILAYGAVLQPKKAGKIKGAEGSRTKAATGASNYGLAVKVSSDGDITIYYDGQTFMKV